METVHEPLYEEQEGSAEERRAAQRAARSLAAKVAKLHGALPMPIAAQQLLTATASNDYRVNDVVRIIGSDPMLASRVMRQVHAALGGRTRCTSISQAVTLLGVRAIRTTALAASVFEVLGADEAPLISREIHHAGRTAALARVLSTASGIAPEEAYTCGLLHDVGRLLLLRGDDLDYADLLRRGSGPDELHQEERARYGFDHALLAGHVLSAWKLPHPIPRVVSWHHQPRRAYASAGAVPRLVAVVRIADQLAHVLAPDEAPDIRKISVQLGQMIEELAVLGFSADMLEHLSELIFDAETSPPPAEHGANNLKNAPRDGPPPLPSSLKIKAVPIVPVAPVQRTETLGSFPVAPVAPVAPMPPVHWAETLGSFPAAPIATAPLTSSSSALDSASTSDAPRRQEDEGSKADASPNDGSIHPTEPTEAPGTTTGTPPTEHALDVEPLVDPAAAKATEFDPAVPPQHDATDTSHEAKPHNHDVPQATLRAGWFAEPNAVALEGADPNALAADGTTAFWPKNAADVVQGEAPPVGHEALHRIASAEPSTPVQDDLHASNGGAGVPSDPTDAASNSLAHAPASYDPISSIGAHRRWTNPWSKPNSWQRLLRALAQGTGLASLLLGGSVLEFFGSRATDPAFHALCITVPAAVAFAFGTSLSMHAKRP